MVPLRVSPGRLTLKNVSSLIPNSPKLDTVQMPTQDEGTSKRWRALHPHCRTHSAMKATGPLLPTVTVMWGCPGRSSAEEEKPGTEEHTGLPALLHLSDPALFTT